MSKTSILSNNMQEKNGSSKNLSDQFIYSVLGQQQQYKKHKNKQNLTKLIELYRKLVEHYSEKNDKISLYFMDKIGQISCDIPSLTQPQEKLTMSMTRQCMEQQQNLIDPRFKTVITTPTKYDPEIKKKQRSKNAQIAIQVSKIKKRANARTILKSYYDECIQNNILVNADLMQQRKQLQQKLNAINKKSMQRGNMRIIL